MSESIVGERIIQMDWVCRYCRHRNPGLAGEDQGMRCAGCGHPKDVEEYGMPGDTSAAESVTDPRLLELAGAGENRPCPACGSEVRALAPQCPSCGSVVPAAAIARESRPPPASEDDDDDAPAPPREPRRSRRLPTVSLPALLGAVVFLLALGAAALWFSEPHKTVYTATIISIAWRRVEHLEERHVERATAWYAPEIGAFNMSCERKQHGTEPCRPHTCDCHRAVRECNCTGGDEYDCNPHKVEYECHCTSGDRYDCNPHEVEYDCRCRGGEEYDCRCQNVEKCVPLKNGAAKCTTRRVCDTCTRPRRCDTCTRTEHDRCTRPRTCDTCSRIEHDRCERPRKCAQCPYTECDTCYDQCPVQDQLCTFDVFRWASVRTEATSGGGADARWSGLSASGEEQRVVHDSEEYSVILGAGERTWTVKLPSVEEFQRFRVGDRREIEVDPTSGEHRLLGPSD